MVDYKHPSDGIYSYPTNDKRGFSASVPFPTHSFSDRILFLDPIPERSFFFNNYFFMIYLDSLPSTPVNDINNMFKEQVKARLDISKTNEQVSTEAKSDYHIFKGPNFSQSLK